MRAHVVIDSLRLTWRLQRWEIVVLIGAALLLAAVGAFAAWQLPITTQDLLDCIGDSTGEGIPARCRSIYDWAGYLSGAGTIVQGAVTVVPLVAGVLLGAPLLSREIEKRTAPLAWSLARSRGWWLAGRVLPIALAIFGSLLLLGQASEASIVATPGKHLGFETFAMHGPVVAVRGLAAFAIGVFIGLWMGRMLPAILVTGVLVIALLGGLQIVRGQLMEAEAVWTPVGENGLDSFSSIYGDGYTDDVNGAFVTDEEAYARYPEQMDTGDGQLPGLTRVYRVVPPERYPVFVAREMGALFVVSIVAIGAALLLVRSRRPE